MNFFEHQEVARRSSTRLIVLFVLAVIGVVIAVNSVGAFLYLSSTSHRGPFGPAAGLPRGFFLTNTAIVVLLIGGGTWFELSRLAGGGEVVARMAGGRPVDPGTRDLLERRLVNVVEEMALAAGIPVPRVFVLDNETTINAFAAGHSVNDAVVTVTHGTLTRLSRDELQGVIGHELSHILNGDMRLNLRLIGVLFGLLMIAMFGRFMMDIGRGSRSDRGAGPLMLAGVAVWIIGYVGVFFGRLIKAGVSRQREFLADASSVQFTRNPDGIGGALRKIGGLSDEVGLGSEIRHPNAEQLSHLFLGAARSSFVSGLFATHPPLTERVRRVYGRSMEFLPAPEQPLAVALAGADQAAARAGEELAPLEFTPRVGNFVSPVASMVAGNAAAASVHTQIGVVSSSGREAALSLAQRLDLPELRAAVVDTTAAQMLVFSLLLDQDGTVGEQQRRALSEAFGAPAVQAVDRYYAIVQQLPPGVRLSLLDRVMPSLRRLPQAAAQRLLMLAHTMIAADGRVTLAEFLLFTVLKRRLGPDAGRAVPVRFRAVAEVAGDAGLVLSLIANVRLADAPERAFKAGLALLPGVDAKFVPHGAIALDAVATGLARLNQLAPLVKPVYIKACTAVAFVDGETNWKAASCLRTICIALDSPLPPQVIAEQDLPQADQAPAAVPS
ncbi:MAG TPA: M48 family metallopeptidase [Burkholderiaceae bacterium]|nr:M48 family metallopeptidase [Burkholderiaceae bacterium]